MNTCIDLTNRSKYRGRITFEGFPHIGFFFLPCLFQKQ